LGRFAKRDGEEERKRGVEEGNLMRRE